MPESSVNPVTVEGALLGRYLFYDSTLSADKKMSCSSCHKQAYAFSDSPNQFSKGRNGELMRRNTMSLFNLAWYPSFFWDGSAPSLEAQVSHPLTAHNEMNMQWKNASKVLSQNKMYLRLFINAFGSDTIDSLHISYALAQFLRTLISNQSKYDRVIGGKGHFTEEEAQGFVLMNDQTKGDCLHCHTNDADALGTNLKFSNNGLDSITNPNDYIDKGRGTVTGNNSDNGKFIVPTLRNIALTGPYMHDGRFKTLKEVLDFYNTGVKLCANLDSKMEFAHQGGVKLSDEEKKDIIAFLETMTDSDFISNPEFKNPFIQAR